MSSDPWRSPSEPKVPQAIGVDEILLGIVLGAGLPVLADLAIVGWTEGGRERFGSFLVVLVIGPGTWLLASLAGLVVGWRVYRRRGGFLPLRASFLIAAPMAVVQALSCGGLLTVPFLVWSGPAPQPGVALILGVQMVLVILTAGVGSRLGFWLARRPGGQLRDR